MHGDIRKAHKEKHSINVLLVILKLSCEVALYKNLEHQGTDCNQQTAICKQAVVCKFNYKRTSSNLNIQIIIAMCKL